MTFQNSSNDLLVISKYLVAPNPEEGKYTTIQGAIDDAVTDGASAASPLNIIIKPGTYAENLTLADGVNLVGVELNSAILTGTITLSSGTCRMEKLRLIRTGDMFSISGGTLNISRCIIAITNGDVFNFTTSTSKSVNILLSGVSGSGNSTLMTHDGTDASIGFTLDKSSTFFNVIPTTIAGPLGRLIFGHLYNQSTSAYVVNVPTLTWAMNACGTSVMLGNPFITTGATTTGAIRLLNSEFAATQALFSIGNATCALEPVMCLITGTGGFQDNTIAASGSQRATLYQVQNGVNDNDSGLWFSSGRQGYRKAEERTVQGFIQTANAVATDIWSYTLETTQGVTIKAHVSGKIADSSAYCGGEVIATARRAGGGAVLVGVSSTVLEDSAGAPLFDINVNGNDVRLQVTGVAAETWNWASTIRYQRIEDET